MTRLTLLLPIAALALTSCDTPYFAAFPDKAAKNRVATPGDPRGGTVSRYGDDALLSSIPPSPISTDRGGVDIPAHTPAAPYDPNKKISLEQLTEAQPSAPNTPTNTRPTTPTQPNVANQQRETEPQPVHWFGRPNEGNTAAIPVGPTKKP